MSEKKKSVWLEWISDQVEYEGDRGLSNCHIFGYDCKGGCDLIYLYNIE